ncbi:diacylglycerol kinase 7-like [Papaver somniferum]|uniref:diacylglycerol kinase 7-like n=1 Tax=Papaver somniferum TaxID=3469 RepID=UPI000E6F7FEF|nr:diacylglycerol kinase 7-like [Papaver somniferum]
MASSAMIDESKTRITSRSSLIDSIGCGLNGVSVIDEEELKRKILIPKYLRVAMCEAIQTKNPNVGFQENAAADDDKNEVPEAPMVVFVNSKSGGRKGSALQQILQEFISKEQVFDLSVVKPHEFVHYGLACLENLASCGDLNAKETREKLRIIVAGGDGTVGWVLGNLTELLKQNREPVPPTGIIPLGTGNDLSRTFNWGGSFPFPWKSTIKRTLNEAITAPISRLDSWNVVVTMPAGDTLELPHCLRYTEDYTHSQDMDGLPEKTSSFEGVFYNYFSVGMDAQVAYGFHSLRNQNPYLAQGPVANKIIYSSYSCTQGWFCTPCMSTPNLRGLKNIVRLYIKKVNCSDWEQVRVPSSVRSIVCLNLHNYGGGRNPWGNLKPQYLEKRGFVEAHADDGLLEIFGLKEGWHASFVMVELISAKHIAQAAAIRMEVRGGDWKKGYMQMDGEPWKQPMHKEYSTFVDIARAPFQSRMITRE